MNFKNYKIGLSFKENRILPFLPQVPFGWYLRVQFATPQIQSTFSSVHLRQDVLWSHSLCSLDTFIEHLLCPITGDMEATDMSRPLLVELTANAGSQRVSKLVS